MLELRVPARLNSIVSSLVELNIVNNTRQISHILQGHDNSCNYYQIRDI